MNFARKIWRRLVRWQHMARSGAMQKNLCEGNLGLSAKMLRYAAMRYFNTGLDEPDRPGYIIAGSK
jgi:hypothetical protein